MTKEENIIIPRWFLENVENTSRIQNNINLDKKTEETCQDRNVRESLNGLRKLLKGEELTGMERLEKLQPFLPSNLDEAAEEWCKTNNKGIALSADKKSHYLADGMDAFIAGAEWMAGQGITLEGRASRRYENGLAGFVSWILFDQQKAAHLLVNQGEEADVIINIRKK